MLRSANLEDKVQALLLITYAVGNSGIATSYLDPLLYDQLYKTLDNFKGIKYFNRQPTLPYCPPIPKDI